jgi:hypothetical protein
MSQQRSLVSSAMPPDVVTGVQTERQSGRISCLSNPRTCRGAGRNQSSEIRDTEREEAARAAILGKLLRVFAFIDLASPETEGYSRRACSP